MVENIWCIEAFNGNIYAAYSKCIKRFDGDTLEVVDMNFEEQPSVHRLTATERKLMSIGEYDLVEYDAKEWRYIRCPENEQ